MDELEIDKLNFAAYVCAGALLARLREFDPLRISLGSPVSAKYGHFGTQWP